MRPGIHLRHKPIGATSFELVRGCIDEISKLGLSSQLPVCHGGALDPFAEGLVLLLVGQATRLMDLVHAAPKSYLATVSWGVETDTGDHLGKFGERGDPGALNPELLDAALASFLGWHEQVPPLTSNKRVDGERAYVKAHRGEVFEVPASKVYLHSARWRSHSLPTTSTLELSCKGGFYVRSLVRDLGRKIGARAHLSALNRTSIGPWSDSASGSWIHGRGLLPWLPARELDDAEADALEQGRAISRAKISAPSWILEAYPGPELPIRGLLREKLVAMLEPRGDELATAIDLRGGL